MIDSSGALAVKFFSYNASGFGTFQCSKALVLGSACGTRKPKPEAFWKIRRHFPKRLMLTEVADLEPQTLNEPKMIIRKIKHQLTTAPAIFVSICYALVLRVWAKSN